MEPQLTEPVPAPPQDRPAAARATEPVYRTSQLVARFALIAAALALAASAWLWLDGRSERQALRQELARRLSEVETQNKESRIIAGQSQEAAKELQVKLGVLEEKLTQSQNQQVALEALYLELSRNRDDWALSEIEQIVLIAAQQLQLAGDVRPALLALEAAEARLQRMDRPQLIPLRKVIAQDIERLKAVPFVDTVGISVRLDTIAAQLDRLPLAMEMRRLPEKLAAPLPPVEESAWRRVAREVWQDVKQIVRIQKLDHAYVPLLSPEEVFFLRENLRLRLLSARLALLQRDQTTFQADIRAARDWIDRYFDTQSRAVTATLATLRDLGDSPVSIEVPDISASLDAVRNYKLVRDEAPREVIEPVPASRDRTRGGRVR